MYNNYKTNETTSIKDAAISFDIFIRDGGVGASLFFVLILLIIVNAHSLHFLLGDGVANWIFSVVGAIGFSMATTAVIRKPVAKWMKFVFPVFDTLLVFLGFNILNEAIPVHLIMTVLFALFTGAILVSLGTINHNEQTQSDESELMKMAQKVKELEMLLKESQSKEIETNRIINDLKRKADESASYNSDLKSKLNHSGKVESELNELKSIQIESAKRAEAIKNKLNETTRLLSDTLVSHIMYESWLSKKKREDKRNGYDSIITSFAERIKAGETIEVKEYMKAINRPI